MVWLAGVDGCKAGWFRALRHQDTDELRFDVLDRIEEVLSLPPRPTIVALDIPIGLPARGQRECDRAARKCIGPRRSSVFRAPIRPTLTARSRAEADAIGRQVEKKGVSAQAWGIFAKVREVDILLREDERAREAIYEVHPEVSFWAWNGRFPMALSKKKRDGLREREGLAAAWLGAGILQRARSGRMKKDLADDDILDAIAALWTAHRIARGSCAFLPEVPPSDETDLPMRIVF